MPASSVGFPPWKHRRHGVGCTDERVQTGYPRGTRPGPAVEEALQSAAPIIDPAQYGCILSQFKRQWPFVVYSESERGF